MDARNDGLGDEYLDCAWTPETPSACPFCSGNLCNKCGAGSTGFTGKCEHDSLERHEKWSQTSLGIACGIY